MPWEDDLIFNLTFLLYLLYLGKLKNAKIVELPVEKRHLSKLIIICRI